MSPYTAILSARFRTLLQYRAAAIAGCTTQVFWGFIRLMIFGAFYESATGPQPMTWPQVATYVWLGQALLTTLPWNLDNDVAAMIRSGSVAYELLRPADLYNLWYARAVAQRSAPPVLRAFPIITLGMVILPLIGAHDLALAPPASIASGIAFAASVIALVALSAAITTLLTITLMWTIAGEGFVLLAFGCVMLFSGLIVPLPLFPDWMQPLLRFLPFAGLADTPFRLYSGNLPPTAAWAVLAHQLAWTAALILLGRWLVSRGTRRLVIQGG